MTEQEDSGFKYSLDDFEDDGSLKGSSNSIPQRIVSSAKAGLNNAITFYLLTFILYPIANIFGFRATYNIFVAGHLPAIYELCLVVGTVVFLITFVLFMIVGSVGGDSEEE